MSTTADPTPTDWVAPYPAPYRWRFHTRVTAYGGRSGARPGHDHVSLEGVDLTKLLLLRRETAWERFKDEAMIVPATITEIERCLEAVGSIYSRKAVADGWGSADESPVLGEIDARQAASDAAHLLEYRVDCGRGPPATVAT